MLEKILLLLMKSRAAYIKMVKKIVLSLQVKH